MKVLGLVFAVIMFSAPAVFAKGPCKEDRQKCMADGVKPGEGRLIQCFYKERETLSATCKEHHAKKFALMEQKEKACGADFKKHCPDKMGKELRQCMKDVDKKTLSEECKGFRSSSKEARHELKALHKSRKLEREAKKAERKAKKN